MATHKIQIRNDSCDRIASGQRRFVTPNHNRDYQAGDTLHIVRVNDRNWPIEEFIERDERGRFVNERRQVAPVVATITHVLPGTQSAAVDDERCVLSIEVVEP